MRKHTTLLAALLFTNLLCYSQSGVIHIVGGKNSKMGFYGDGGPATNAELNTPHGIAIDASNNIYIADFGNNRIRKIDNSGIISTIAGNGIAGFSGDNGPATAAELNGPFGVACDGKGNIYIADFNNQRIRKLDTTGTITTAVGTGTAGYNGDAGAATSTKLNEPTGVTVDAKGDLYIADSRNMRIRKMSITGNMSTVAGNGIAGYSGDGSMATSAELNWPIRVMLDANGSMYISDQTNNCVRVVNSLGTISTIAGDTTWGYSGDGGPATAAEISNPWATYVDPWGNIFIADLFNNRIRYVNPSGSISTIAGNGFGGGGINGMPATSVSINPCDVCEDYYGNLYEVNANYHDICKIDGPLSINNLSEQDNLNVYPNPATNKLYIRSTAIAGKISLSLYNLSGQQIMAVEKEATNTITISVEGLPTGIYLLKLQAADGSILSKKIEIIK